MEKSQILCEVQNIFREVLDNEEIELQEFTTSDDIIEWDSLSHIQLIVEIEKYFKLDFPAAQIISWKNVGDMVNYIYESQK